MKYPFVGGPAQGERIEVPQGVTAVAVPSCDGMAIYQKNYRTYPRQRLVYFAFSHFEKEAAS